MGSFLSDRDECKDDPCHNSATCANTLGSFSCTCNVGFSGNGFECEGIRFRSNSEIHNHLWEIECIDLGHCTHKRHMAQMISYVPFVKF